MMNKEWKFWRKRLKRIEKNNRKKKKKKKINGTHQKLIQMFMLKDYQKILLLMNWNNFLVKQD